MARVAFVGSKKVGLSLLRSLTRNMAEPHQIVGAITIDDSSDSRSELMGFRRFAASNNLALVVKEPRQSVEELLYEWMADTVIVSGWYSMIDVDAANTAKFYGFHFSPLPKYRGSAPLVWQIIQGENQLGVSFFQLTAVLDEGDIVDREVFTFGENETVADALRKVELAANRMLTKNLLPLLDGELILRPQDQGKPSYCALRIPEDGLIDWRLPAEEVHNLVRAQTRPYPGAFSMMPDGRSVHIWRTEVEKRLFIGVPGAVAARDDGVIITCGTGAIRVIEAEIAGAGAASPREIFPSLRFRLKGSYEARPVP